jgi:smad nuclear-interacting protein 1
MPRSSDSPRYRARYQDNNNRDSQESRRFDPRDFKNESDARRGSRSNWGYDERQREQERTRDRERYESARDRDGDRDRDRRSSRERPRSDYDRGGSGRAGPSRRSASPPRSRNNQSERPRSNSRSRSPSPDEKEKNKGKPNFKPSGLLAAETNTVKSADGKTSSVLKYNEPPEARKPVLGWRLYVFKGKEQVGMSLIFACEKCNLTLHTRIIS